MEFKNLKGTRDYMPEEQIERENIKDVLVETFRHYGFSPVETPILNMEELLKSKYSEGADILKEIYSLSDQGNRGLGLRYDLTVTNAKMVSIHKPNIPYKRYEIGKVFRDGPVKTGRMREFTQCDVDIVGVKNNLIAEVEFFMMSVEVFKKLNIDIVIKYNNRKLLNGILMKAGVDADKLEECLIIIDKFEKMSEDEIIEEFERIGISNQIYDEIKNMLNMSIMELEESSKNEEIEESNTDALLENNKDTVDLFSEGLKEIKTLQQYINEMGIGASLKFTPSLARGINVYTSSVWEIFAVGSEVTSSIAAGGRYDDIIGKFIDDGKEYPAVGMTFGIDVIFSVLEARGREGKKTVTEVLIIPAEPEKKDIIKAVLKMATKFRRTGLNVEVEMSGKKVKKAMKYANNMEIENVIVIGSDELEEGKVVIHNMNTGEDRKVAL